MNGVSPTVPASEDMKTVGRRRESLRQYSPYAFFGILLLAISWGLFVRFNGLRSRPLAEDEYLYQRIWVRN